MSYTRTAFEYSVLDRLITGVDCHTARKELAELAKSDHPFKDEHLIKAADVGHLTVSKLIEQAQAPKHPPVISDEYPGEMKAFLSEFGVGSLCDLEDSLPVYLSGCSVVIEEIMTWSNLTQEERARVPEMYSKLPAVRINFVPTVV